MDYWLGIDCGGTYLKAGLYDTQGQELAIQRGALVTISEHPGWAERDLDKLWACCVDTLKKLLICTGVQGKQIQGIGISAQGKGVFLLDERGRPLGHGILSSDRRALEIVRHWEQAAIPQQLYPLTRQTLWTGHPVSILRWVKQHQPERYHQIGTLLMAHDYLRFCFTGELHCEETNISESNLYHMSRGTYDPQLSALLGIPEIDSALAPIVGSAEVCGRVSHQVAGLTGLMAGTPVVGGLFDVVSAALCAGLHDESSLNIVQGTWAVTSAITPMLKEEKGYPYVYGRFVIPDHYIVHEASPTSSANLEWLTQQYGGLSFADCNQAVAALPKADTEVLFLPFLYGSNAGLAMNAGFYGLQALHQREHLLQAVYEGVVFSHMTHLQRMREHFTQVRCLRVTGGATHSAVWMQMLADVSELPVALAAVEEAGCLGAALAALVGGGVYRSFIEAQQRLSAKVKLVLPDPQIATAYQNKLQRYRWLIASLQNYHQRCATWREAR